MLDFTPDEEVADQSDGPLEFKFHGDVYEAAPVMPAGAVQDYVAMLRADRGIDRVAKAEAVLNALLLPESRRRFAERIRDPEQPVPDKQLADVLFGLVAAYGDRPTGPSQESAAESDGTPGDSTDGAPPEESTPEPSASPAG